jgi:WD40 repeat protein
LVFVQDVAQGKLEAVLPQANIVSAIAFSPDGGRLACGTIDKVTLWDLARRREIGAIRGLKGGVTSLDFTPDGFTLVTTAESQPPQYWDVRQLAAEENGRKLDSNGVQALAISPDGRYLAVGEGDFFQPFKPSDIRLWELPSGREVGVFKGHTAAVTLLAFDADGRGLISASLDQTARRWDVPSGRAVPLAASTNGDWGTVAAVSPQGRLATYRMNEPPATNTLNIVDPVTGQVLATFPSALANLGSVPVARFSPDGSLVAAMGETNVVTVWEVTSRPRAPTLQHSDDQTNMTFSPDGRYLASRHRVATLQHSDDRTTMTFSPDGRYLASWHRVATLSQPDGLMSLAFSPDGRYLATGSENGRVRLLDIRSGRVVTDLEGHRHVVVALAFTPDGARLVSASIDRTIKIWSLPAGRELITLKGHQVNLTAAVFSPDGNTLITSSADGEVRFWRAATADEIPARENASDASAKLPK